MAAETQILEFPIAEGQNEGVSVEVLPVGQFSAVLNARFRKQNLLGKRNGYTSKSSLDASGAALGNGSGLLSCLGPEFCVVDDRLHRRDATADAWALPPSATGSQARTLVNRFPEFMPGAILETTTQESLTAAEDAEGGIAYALGYLWTAEGRATSGGWVVHVDAVDPATGLVVFGQEIALASAANTDEPHVQLVTTPGGSLVLVTDTFSGGSKSAITWCVLTTLAGGFGSPASFPCTESSVNYATDATRPDTILFTCTLTATPSTISVGYLNVNTGAYASGNYAVGGIKARHSCFQAAGGGLIRVGYEDLAGPVVVAVQTWTAALVVLATQSLTTLIGGATAPVLFAERSSGTAVAITADTTDLHGIDIDATGSLVIASATLQVNCEPLSWPFSISGRPFIWLRYVAGEGLGVATLARVPGATEYPATATLPGVWPVNATVDDRDVASPLVARTAGSPLSTPLATPLGYVALLNYTRETYVVLGGTTERRRAYMLVPVRHRSEGVRYSASCVVPCWGRQFVASAQPQWVDRISAYEAGFIQAPLSISTTPGGGGGLTPSSTYSWTCIFQSTDGSSVDRSAPAVPVTVALGGAETSVELVWTTDEIGSRRQVAARIYRTLANGSVFQFCGEGNATPGSTNGEFTFTDDSPDDVVSQNETLYINIGQEQPASNFPACSFANTGGGRLWVGGGFSGNIVSASKQFAPRLAPEFADDDAFRVTLPETCTGAAWCDAQVLFTQEGIYVVNGEGPDVAGVGYFTTTRLPFNIGCIDWRSVAVSDLGIFFQSARGLYLLPRGFGAPVAMDQVLDTLTTYPIITAARSNYNSSGGADNSEQLVQWCAVADEAATSGVVITFDVAYKCFYVDTFGADYPAAFLSGWSGEAVQSPATMTVGPNGAAYWHPFRLRNTAFSDAGLPILMRATTGDVRPWGTFSHGVVNRVGVLGVLKSACTISATKRTDVGSAATTRGYTAVAPDYVAGDALYLEVNLGNTEQRDITALRLTVAETSAVEGVALVGMIFEHDAKPQGFRLLKPADRIT